jgi:hypothetical protein
MSPFFSTGYCNRRGLAEVAALEALHKVAANAHSLIEKSRRAIEETDRRLSVASNRSAALCQGDGVKLHAPAR